MAGSLAALALADAGFTCVLAEKFPLSNQKQPLFDGRTTAIAYAGQRLLDKLDLWAPLAKGAGPIEQIIVTDGRPKDRFRQGGTASGFLHFDSKEISDGDHTQPLGWIVENRFMRAAFIDAMQQKEKITLKAPASWTRIVNEGGHQMVTFENGDKVKASLVIGADGRPSPVRVHAGIRTSKWSYGQTGIVCTISSARDHHNIAQEFFTPGGPFAVLPLPQQRASLVWTETTAMAKAIVSLPEPELMHHLENNFGPYLGELKLAGPVWAYPLSFLMAEKFYTDRIALIGDAAHGVHPIAGQGFNLGIKDIAALRDVLHEAALAGLDIGHGSVLERYQRWRHFDTAALAFGMDALTRLFSTDNAALHLARSTGLGMVNKVAPLRKFFMRQAGGEAGDLPSLMRA